MVDQYALLYLQLLIEMKLIVRLTFQGLSKISI